MGGRHNQRPHSLPHSLSNIFPSPSLPLPVQRSASNSQTPSKAKKQRVDKASRAVSLAEAKDSRPDRQARDPWHLKQGDAMALSGRNHRTPLHAAAADGRTDRLEELLRAGVVDINEPNSTDGSTPLILAAERGHVTSVELLLNWGASLEARKTTDQWTALHIAAYNGHSQVVQLLIDRGANVDCADCELSTPLHVATLYGYSDVISQLLAKGADTSSLDHKGRAPLHLACRLGHREVVSLLLSHSRGLVSASDTDESATPLHETAGRGDAATVQLLLDAGADPEAVDAFDLTPVDWAAQAGHRDALNRLLLQVTSEMRVGRALKLAAAFGHGDCVLALLGQGGTQMKATPMPELIRQVVVEQILQGGPVLRLPAGHMDTATTAGERPVEAFNLCRLFEALERAGFTQERMRLLHIRAQVHEDVIRAQSLDSVEWSHCQANLVGSLRDGCGNSVTCADGSTEPDSDIDVMLLDVGRKPLHIELYCQCGEPEGSKVQYTDGHVMVSGAASNPSKYYGKSRWRSAMDTVAAFPCCCYPTLKPLQRPSHLPKQVLEELEKETRRPKSCHLVSAASPNHQGEQQRISTTFLERIIMQNLTTVQCWFFVTLKFLVKRHISAIEQGLKSYHVKTLLFQLLDESPPEMWELQRFRQLMLQALETLETQLRKAGCHSELGFMDHFFLPDAKLYLKGSGDAHKIAEAVRATIDSLDERLRWFSLELRSLGGDERIKYEPFLNLPLFRCCLTLPQESDQPRMPAARFYDTASTVTQCLDLLSAENSSTAAATGLDEIPIRLERVGDWALAARVSLEVLRLLRLGQREEATQKLLVLISSGAVWEPSGLLQPQDCESTETLWRRLMHRRNFSVKFCCRLDDSYQLCTNIPGFNDNMFPIQLQNHINAFYMNFNALAIYLAVMLAPKCIDDTSVMRLAASPDADMQELFLALHFGQDHQRVVELVQQHKKTIGEEPVLQRLLRERFRQERLLEAASIEKTILDLITDRNGGLAS